MKKPNPQTQNPKPKTQIGLIIAAGAGTRLADDSNVPKPLRKVCGIPLLRRTIFTAAKAGLTQIYIVVGFQKEKIQAYIKRHKWPIKVDFIENNDWKKSNGLSVYAAKDVIKEDFILMMSDHVFDYNTLQKLVETGLGSCKAKLAIDYKTHQIFDTDDATKVEVKEDRIANIGKNLLTYNAIDTGLFLLSPEIFSALEHSMKNSDCSLSDGIKELANTKQMGVFDIGDAFWQDVDTPASLKHAENILVQACRKPTDGIISRNFNRYISTFISRRLVKMPITANQFTFFVLFLGLASGHLAAQGHYITFLLAGILFKLTSILDGVDGEMSKLKFTNSKFGQWLDTICDNVTYVVFLLGTVMGLYRQDYPYATALTVFALAGFGLALAAIFWYLFTHSKSGSLIAVQKDFLTRPDLNLFSKILVKLQFTIKRDFFALLFMILAILGKPQWVLFLVGFATNIAWITIVQQQVLSLRKKT